MNSPAQALQPHVAFPTAEGSTWRELMHEQVQELVTDLAEQGYLLSTVDGKDALIDAAIRWDLKIRNKRIELFIQRHFWTEIERLTGVDKSYIFEHLEEVQAQQRKEKHEYILAQGMEEAVELFVQKKTHLAQKRLLQSIADADNALAERPAAPIVTLAESLGSLRQSLKRTQGVKFTGMPQFVIPELDEATGGFQGLNLITAKSGEGKTMFVIQCMLEILSTRENTCCLFVSLDMVQDRVNLRCLVNRTRLPIRTVISGTSPLGWDVNEAAIIEKGFEELDRLGKRVRILDRFNFPHATAQNIARERERLMEETGCVDCITIIDFLELMPVSPEEKNPDDWLIEQVRWLADQDVGPVFCIAESNKSGGNYERGSAEKVKGSYRKIMRSDCVLTLSAFEDQELLDNWDINEHSKYLSVRMEPGPYKVTKAAEAKQRAGLIREELRKLGKVPIMLKIDKARDGAEKCEINIVNHFRQNYFTPLRG